MDIPSVVELARSSDREYRALPTLPPILRESSLLSLFPGFAPVWLSRNLTCICRLCVCKRGPASRYLES
jgi:hypothetical protein